MLGAWSKFRFKRGAVTFAAALRHSWAWLKGEAERAAATDRWEAAPQHRVMVLRSTTSSPIGRNLAGRPYAGRQAWEAGRLTSRLGL